MRQVGFLTIGQAPRWDMAEEVLRYLPEDVKLVQLGALDGMNREEIEAAPFREKDAVLVTRLADGADVRFPASLAETLLKKQIQAMERMEIRSIYLSCTWKFQNLGSQALLLEPQEVLFGLLGSVLKGKTAGVCVPDERQAEAAFERWSLLADRVLVAQADAYEVNEGTRKAAEKLKAADVVILDCMGYGREARDCVAGIVKKPVVLPRALAAKVFSELL